MAKVGDYDATKWKQGNYIRVPLTRFTGKKMNCENNLSIERVFKLKCFNL